MNWGKITEFETFAENTLKKIQTSAHNIRI